MEDAAAAIFRGLAGSERLLTAPRATGPEDTLSIQVGGGGKGIRETADTWAGPLPWKACVFFYLLAVSLFPCCLLIREPP